MQLGMIGLGRMGANMVRRLHARRPQLRRLRPSAPSGRRPGRGRRDGRGVARRLRREAEQAARRSG